MKIEIDVDAGRIGDGLSRTLTEALVKGADEAARYGSLGRSLKDAAERTAQRIAAEVLSDPEFQAKARASLSAGILRGIEARGEKIARGMSLQQALALDAAGREKGAKP